MHRLSPQAKTFDQTVLRVAELDQRNSIEDPLIGRTLKNGCKRSYDQRGKCNTKSPFSARKIEYLLIVSGAATLRILVPALALHVISMCYMSQAFWQRLVLEVVRAIDISIVKSVFHSDTTVEFGLFS